MLKIKTLVMAAAISTGAVLAMPAASQAMPASAPVKMQVAKDGNIVDVRHRRRHYARYCYYHNCYRRHRYARFHYYPYYYDPYSYGYYEPYPYYGYYRPYYRPYWGPGIGFSFRF